MTPDVNVLVAAGRAEHLHYAAARAWLDEAVRTATAAAPLVLLPTVVVGYLRVATDQRFYAPPTPTRDALANVTALIARSNVRFATHGDEWPRLAELCERHALSGKALTDAWIAATVLQLNEHLVTFDRGFRRLLPPRHLTVLTA